MVQFDAYVTPKICVKIEKWNEIIKCLTDLCNTCPFTVLAQT